MFFSHIDECFFNVLLAPRHGLIQNTLVFHLVDSMRFFAYKNDTFTENKKRE